VNGEEWPVLEAGVGQVFRPGHEYGRPENKSNLSSQGERWFRIEKCVQSKCH
jgi:hypothetical protein